MLNVKIVKTEPKSIAWGAKPGRDAGSMRVQEAWIFTLDRDTGKPGPFPEKIDLVLDRATETRAEQPAYAAGDYELHPSSIYIDRNGRLSVAPRLTPKRGA